MSDFFTGESGKVTQSTAVDPSQQRINDLYFGELLGLKNAGGSAAKFAGAQPNLFGLGSAEDTFRKGTLDAAANPGFGFYPSTLASLSGQANRFSNYAGEAMDFARQPVAGPTDLEALNSIRSLLGRSLQGPSDLEMGSLGAYGSRLNPDLMLKAAQDYMNIIGEPAARASSVAGGMGGVRGGAFQEGLARQSAQLMLPILQLINQNVGEFGSAQERIGGALEGRRAGLSGGLFGMGSELEARGMARRGFAGNMATQAAGTTGAFGQLLSMLDASRLASLKAGSEAAAMPRLLSLQDYLRQQDLTMSALLRTPVKTGSITTQTSNQDLTLGSLLGPASTAAAAYLLRK